MQVEEAVSVAVTVVEAAEAGQEAGNAGPEVRTLDQQEQLLVSLWRQLQPLLDHAAQLGQTHLLRHQPLYLEKTKCQAQSLWLLYSPCPSLGGISLTCAAR